MKEKRIIKQIHDIYSANFVKNLFNEMSNSYERMNYITSFGFSERWRKQCMTKVEISPKMVVYDLMTGMGEMWSYILKDLVNEGKLIAVDFSEGMLKNADNKKEIFNDKNIIILEKDVLLDSFDIKADCLISTFGLKTFSEEQLNLFAKKINEILKTGGTFSFIEVSKPNNKLLSFFYFFYLKKIIPILGKLFLGNPENYRMLGIYTEKFANCRRAERIFRNNGFTVNYAEYFFGCASGIYGKKN